MKIRPLLLTCTTAALLTGGVASSADWSTHSDLHPQKVSSVGLAQVASGRAGPPGPGSSSVPDAPAQRILQAYGRLPLAFVENKGQTDSRVKFISRGPGYTLYLASNDAVLVLSKGPQRASGRKVGDETGSGASDNGGFVVRAAERVAPPAVLRMMLAGASPAAAVTGVDEQPGKSHYFLGNDPKKWRTNVASYARVQYREVYAKVDLVYYGNQRELEYDFIVKPGGDPAAIMLDFHGADRLQIDPQGNLLMQTQGVEIQMRKPIVYQEAAGVRREVAGGYVLLGKRRVGFRVAAYDAKRPLVIDPALAYMHWSTYLGGNQFDEAYGIAVDSAGNAYVTGDTNSSDFPTLNALQPTGGGFYADVFVTKLNAAGTAIVYSTYLGGSASDGGAGIAIDSGGNAYVVGSTNSSDFPTLNALQTTLGGSPSLFVAKLNAAGSALVYSTYLGGSGPQFGNAIAVDSIGNAYVTGSTSSSDFPMVNALQPTFGGAEDAFVAKLNATGSALIYSTYLGGTTYDYGYAIAADSAGNAYVTGATASADFPIVNALQPTCGRCPSAPNGSYDAFVAKLDANGTALVYSTYLGGSGDRDFGRGIAVDGAGNTYVTGSTDSTDFPTVNAIQPTLNPSQAYLSSSGFVAKLKLSSTTTLASSASPSVYGQPVTFTATVSGSGPTPTGIVTFSDSGTMLGTATLNGAGQAPFTTSGLAVSSQPIKASYGGDDKFQGSTSPTFAQLVNRASTSTTVASSANPSVFGQVVTFTATVSAVSPGAGAPAGIVTFMDDGSTLGTGTLNGAGQATLTPSGLAVGSHSITASYGGDGNFLGSTSPTLTQTTNHGSTTTAVASSPNPSVLGQAVTFTATVSAVIPGAGTATGTVTFTDGGTTLAMGTLSSTGQATFTTRLLGVGTHSIRATYGGDGNFLGGASPALDQTVDRRFPR